MKKTLLLISIISALNIFGVVWEKNPNFTPEQRERAKEINEQIRNKNKEQESLMNAEITKATQRFIDEIEKIKAKYPPIVG